MTSSDWIAIGALVVACLSIISNYLTNRENIKARRAEAVTEKSLEIYRQLLERLNSVINLGSDTDLTPDKTREFNNAYNEFSQFANANILFIPSSIALELDNMQDAIGNLVDAKNKAYESEKDFVWLEKYEIANKQYEKLVSKLQEYIGLKQ